MYTTLEEIKEIYNILNKPKYSALESKIHKSNHYYELAKKVILKNNLNKQL